jgi:hypothetical protein
VTWVIWNLVSVHLEMVLVLVQDRCTILRQMYHRLRNCFGLPKVLLGDEAHLEACFGLFGEC